MRLLTYIITGFILLSVLFLTSCKKKEIFSSDGINFTVDTLLFDTVFTTVGSTTLSFRILNNSNSKVKIDEINLMGGNNSFFRINVDGISGNVHQDIEIPKKDSIYTFVEVTLDPNNTTNPMIIEDSIRFLVNGKYSYVNLAAWGQDAYFYNADTISVNTTLPNDKPHVIYNYLMVNPNVNLTIQEASNFHLHKDGILYIRKGSLNVNGTKDNPVTFQGDRLEEFYDDVAGQYYGIYFEEALSSEIHFTEIKNGTAGLHLFNDNSSNSDYTLKVFNSKIYNCASYGIFSFRGSRVYGENLLVHNNGTYAFFNLIGGDFYFKQSNFLSYGADASVALAIKNHYFDPNDQTTYVSGINEGKMYNCVIDGAGDYSYGFDTINPDNTLTFDFHFDYSSLRAEEIVSNDNRFENILWNSNMGFVDRLAFDFNLNLGSSLINNGSTSFTHTNASDIDETPRTGVPDIGAYEYQ